MIVPLPVETGVQHHRTAPYDVAKIPSRIDEKNSRVASASTGSVVCRGSHTMDLLERREQDGINGDRRNGRRIRER